jgi:hypothetical protein
VIATFDKQRKVIPNQTRFTAEQLSRFKLQCRKSEKVGAAMAIIHEPRKLDLLIREMKQTKIPKALYSPTHNNANVREHYIEAWDSC